MTLSTWTYLGVSMPLPPEAAASVRTRIAEGGRGGRITVRRANDGASAPIGCIFVRWDAPDGDVMVHRIGWDAEQGGSELAVRRAVKQLTAGQPAAV